MKKILWSLMVGCLFLAAPAAGDILTANEDNAIYFYNYEIVFDSQGNQIDYTVDEYTIDPTTGQVTLGSDGIPDNIFRPIQPGDYFVGIINVQNINVDGTPAWGMDAVGADNETLSGLFVQKVVDVDTIDPYTGDDNIHITMDNTDKLTFTLLGGAELDLNGIINTGEMFVLYHQVDEPTNDIFSSNGTITDDVADATGGDLYMSFGLVEEGDFFYSHINGFLIPLENFEGEAWGNLSVMQNNTGMTFVAVDNSYEDEIGTAAQVYLSSEFEQWNDFPDNSPWVFASNDPAHVYPVPEPSTFVLLGAGLLGLGVVARKRRQG